MVYAYATVALLGSLILGVVVTRISYQYEMNSQKDNLKIAANSYVVQMDETLGRMDAIMQYILSDASMLENITLLADEKKGNVPIRLILEAKSELSTGLSTEYTMKNSYRTVFFNQNSFLASSAVFTPNTASQRLISDFKLEEIPYLEDVTEANGESVIVKPHLDLWGASDKVLVYSLMKALRGDGMGFLEVETRMKSFESLENPDPDIEFLIVVNGDELLYSSNTEYGTNLRAADLEMIRNLQENVVHTKEDDIYIKTSSSDYDLTVLACKRDFLMAEARREFFLSAYLISMITFAATLMLVVFWSRVLTRPVKKLQKVVENTNIENLQENIYLDKVGGSDEFQELIYAYQAMTNRLDKALQDEKRATMLQLQAQFNMLQAQVNPHFIYNVLNTISSRAVLDNDEVICEICGSFGNMLRYSTSSKERYASVERELEYLENYFYLLKARYDERLEVSIDVDAKIRKQMIPKLTIQQFVENSVKHCLNNIDDCLHISVTGQVLEDGWIIRIEDNGTGVPDEILLEMKKKLEEARKNILERGMPIELEIGGLGIVNTYARCMLLYFEDLIFELENVKEGHGFSVTIGQKKAIKDKET